MKRRIKKLSPNTLNSGENVKREGNIEFYEKQCRIPSLLLYGENVKKIQILI